MRQGRVSPDSASGTFGFGRLNPNMPQARSGLGHSNPNMPHLRQGRVRSSQPERAWGMFGFQTAQPEHAWGTFGFRGANPNVPEAESGETRLCLMGQGRVGPERASDGSLKASKNQKKWVPKPTKNQSIHGCFLWHCQQ